MAAQRDRTDFMFLAPPRVSGSATGAYNTCGLVITQQQCACERGRFSIV